MRALAVAVALASSAFAQAPCTSTLTLSPDYSFLIATPGGGVEAGASFRWLLNGRERASGTLPQLFLLHADEHAVATSGREPLESRGVVFHPGRWGAALAVEPGGLLAYAREGAVELNEGAIEMWVAPRYDGDDAVYAERDQYLFHYAAPNGDYISIAQSRTAGVVYAGGRSAGQWQSAWGGTALMRSWRAGEWHHLVYTFSAAQSRMRFYVDGVLAADTNERRYVAPASTGDRFALGGNLSGAAAHYLIDEVRVFNRQLEDAEIRAAAQRLDPPRDHELWLPLEGVSAGGQITFELGACAGQPFVYPGIPVTDPDPPSTLLPPGTTSLPLTVRTTSPASCRWSLGAPRAYTEMTPFEGGQRTTLAGLDASSVNDVYVRCDHDPNYLLHLRYRSLPRVSAPFPRKGNLWGSAGVAAKGLPYAARIDLYLGASFTPSQIRELRARNPNILILTSINTVENHGLPEDYYLHDTQGRRIEVWPGTYRLNLTKRYVAEYQARYAYQRILDAGLMVDGCFFDNFFTSQSWLRADIHGAPVRIDADEDGREDDAAWLDAAWRAGVFLELEAWRRLMPHALASGHLPRPPEPDTAAIFNGDSIGFWTTDVIEGRRSFADLWELYHGWFENGRAPVVMMTESAPPDQIAYGYDYSPLSKIPASTLEFARTYYPYVRFGLAFTLMNDGYFAHEFGDTWHGNDWWYDELDFDLGYPAGPAVRVPLGEASSRNLIENGGFEQPLEGTWALWVNTAAGAAATVTRETAGAVEGAACALIGITAPSSDWHIDFHQRNRSLQRGVVYDLSFWAKADGARTIRLSAQKGRADWRNYGLSRSVNLTTDWKKFTVSFEANETTSESRIQFFVGAATGKVWLDDVRLTEHPPDVYRREFTNGVVLLNGTRQRQTIQLGPGYSRLRGEQAARYEYILDDDGAGFSATAGWREVVYDSGEWKSAGPFYHDWGKSCRQLEGAAGQAQWDLELRADDTYTIAAWWPAAPQASAWSRRVVYEVVAGGTVVASATLDQSTGGDEWHTIATVALARADKPFVRIRNLEDRPMIADALWVRSESRLHDGSPALEVTLEPLDGAILKMGTVSIFPFSRPAQ